MALWRQPADFAFGTLSVAAAIGDTSLSSAQFATLGSGFTTSAVMPIVLLNTATQTREVVWITAHTASSTSVTVVRGKEGTSAQAWPSGTQWICAPTAARDGLPSLTTSQINALTDMHVGMRVLNTDTSQVLEYTFGAGWQAEVGPMRAADVGHNITGGTIPTNATIQIRADAVISAVPAAGLVTVTFPTAFPNACIGGFAGSCDHNLWDGYVAVDGVSTTQAKLAPLSSTGTPGSCSLFYVMFGY
jgi:hypothetical protein